MLPVFDFIGDGNPDEQTVGEDQNQDNDHVKNQLDGVVGKIADPFALLVGRLGFHQQNASDCRNDADQDKGGNRKSSPAKITQHDPEKFKDDDHEQHVVDELKDRIGFQARQAKCRMDQNDHGARHQENRNDQMNDVIDTKEDLPESLDKRGVGIGPNRFVRVWITQRELPWV